jgi:hypothetical protein
MRPALEDEWDLEPWDDDPDGVDPLVTAVMARAG